NDETDGAPQPNPAVAIRIVSQVLQGNDFELGQYAVPEKIEARHHQGEAPKIRLQKHAGIADQGENGPQPDNEHAPVAAITDPAPQVGRHQPGAHLDGGQGADF